MKGILGVLGRKKASEEDLPREEADPVRVNYSSLEALRKGFRDFHDQAETKSNGKATPQEDRKPMGAEHDRHQGGEAPSTGDEKAAVDDGSVWDIFESEKAEDPVLEMLLSQLGDIDAFELLEGCKEVAHQLRRTR